MKNLFLFFLLVLANLVVVGWSYFLSQQALEDTRPALSDQERRAGTCVYIARQGWAQEAFGPGELRKLKRQVRKEPKEVIDVMRKKIKLLVDNRLRKEGRPLSKLNRVLWYDNNPITILLFEKEIADELKGNGAPTTLKEVAERIIRLRRWEVDDYFS